MDFHFHKKRDALRSLTLLLAMDAEPWNLDLDLWALIDGDCLDDSPASETVPLDSCATHPIDASQRQYMDITSVLSLKQKAAAELIGISQSCLSKRWKIAGLGRPWPYKEIRKIDKEIQEFWLSGLNGRARPPIPARVVQLLERRQAILAPVFIPM